MNEELNKVNFDLSELNLNELILLYEQIADFLDFLTGSKIVKEESEVSDDE